MLRAILSKAQSRIFHLQRFLSRHGSASQVSEEIIKGIQIKEIYSGGLHYITESLDFALKLSALRQDSKVRVTDSTHSPVGHAGNEVVFEISP